MKALKVTDAPHCEYCPPPHLPRWSMVTCLLIKRNKLFFPSVRLNKMPTDMTSETHFAAFGSVQKQDLRRPGKIQLSHFAGEIL